MKNNLEVILEIFQKSDCIMVSIMQSVMKFFKYEAESVLYYAFGNARVLTFPFFKECESYFRKCFAYINDVCYFSGAWASEFITEDANGFINKLKEKWFEWADMQQAMPIIVGLFEENQQIMEFYILIGYDKESHSFKFIDENGIITNKAETVVGQKYKLFGFTTIDVPYNFLVKSSYYRDIKMAGVGLVQKAGYLLSNNYDMMDYFRNIMEAVESQDYATTKSMVGTLSNNIKNYRMATNLYRNSYGIALCEFGYHQLGNQYQKLGANWTEIIDIFRKDDIIDLSLIKETILFEHELINRQKGMV